MNTIIISKEKFSDELLSVLKLNGAKNIVTIKSLGLAESKFSSGTNVLIYNSEKDNPDEAHQLYKIISSNKSHDIKALLIIDDNIKDAIKYLIKNDNIKFIFKPATKERLQIGMRMLLSDKKKQQPELKVSYINPFIDATKSILKQLAFTDITKKDVKIATGLTVYGDISGVMALSGEANGFVVISMEFSTALELVKKMTMGDVKEDEHEIIDGGVKELINVISGQAQSAFNQDKYHFDFTTPTMVKGKGHTIDHGIKANSIIVRFETDEKKDLYLQVCLKQ